MQRDNLIKVYEYLMGSYKEARARPIHTGEDKGCYRLLMEAKGWGQGLSRAIGKWGK